VTVITTLVVLTVVGVPEITPVVLFTVNPSGSGVAVHEYTSDPPVALSCVLYDVPLTPIGSDVVVITKGCAKIVSVRAVCAVCGGELESVTVMVRLLVPGTDGAPLIKPDVESDKPRGMVVRTFQVSCPVPPDEVNWYE
jgi:hypothetical protein